MASVQKIYISFKNVFVFSMLLCVMVVISRVAFAQLVTVDEPAAAGSETAVQSDVDLPKAFVWESKSHSFDSIYRADR